MLHILVIRPCFIFSSFLSSNYTLLSHSENSWSFLRPFYSIALITLNTNHTTLLCWMGDSDSSDHQAFRHWCIERAGSAGYTRNLIYSITAALCIQECGISPPAPSSQNGLTALLRDIVRHRPYSRFQVLVPCMTRRWHQRPCVTTWCDTWYLDVLGPLCFLASKSSSTEVPRIVRLSSRNERKFADDVTLERMLSSVLVV